MFKIFLTNLGKYNEGELIGKWVELPCDNLAEELAEIGVADGTMYEEFFITDYENEVGYEVGEYESIDHLNELAERLEQIELHQDGEVIAAIMEANGCELEEALNVYDQGRYINYLEHDTLVELAYELIEENYDLPEFALRYFDYDAFARDLSFEGYTETSYGVIYTE